MKARAAGVEPVDWKIRSGDLDRGWELPAPIGREVSGVVTAIGEGVEGFAGGAEVFGSVAPGYGGFAEHTIVRAAEAVAKPEKISFADAATAYGATHQVGLEPGQRLLILGAGGGLGLITAQIGTVHQFTIIGVAGPTKRKTVESTGATFVAPGRNVTDHVREAAPEGVDLIVDVVGGDTLCEVAGLVVDLHVTALLSLEDADKAIAAIETGHATGKIVIEPIPA